MNIRSEKASDAQVIIVVFHEGFSAASRLRPDPQR